MTDDVPDARPSLDDILQTCDSLHTEGDMTSRERCQALLWEYQAAAAMELEDTVKPQERNPFVRPQMNKEQSLKEVEHGPSDTLESVGEIQKPWRDFTVENSAKLKASSNVSSKEKEKDEGSNPVGDLNNNKSTPFPATADRKRGYSLTEGQKEQLLSLLASAKLDKKALSVLESKETNETQSGANNDALENQSVKPPSPSLHMYPPYGQADLHQVMFSPITPASLSASPSVQSDISDNQRPFGVPNAKFIPIAVPVPNIVSAPMAPFWYMPQGGMIPYPQSAMSPAQFVPITHSAVPSKQSVQSTDTESKNPNILLQQNVERKASRSSTPQSIKGSKLPRPIWQTPISKGKTTPCTSQVTQRKAYSEDDLERITKVNNVRARTPSPSLGRSATKVSTIPRSQTPPVYWSKEETNKPITLGQRTRVSTGSLPSWRPWNLSDSPGDQRRSFASSDSGSLGSGGSRPNSPVQRNRKGSAFSNRSSSPAGSRSSSPVSSLVSKFEQLSQESFESNSKPQSRSVSSLLSRFGSFSLVPEDRMVKGQLKAHVSASVSSKSSSKTGPLRSSTRIDGLQEALDPKRSESSPRNLVYSRRRSRTSGSIADDKRSCASSDGTRDVHRNRSETYLAENKTIQNSLSWESRRRLSSSLGNLFSHNNSVKMDNIANTSLNEEHLERARKWSPLKDLRMNSEEDLNSGENPPIVPSLSDKTMSNEVSKASNPNSPTQSSCSESLGYEEYGNENGVDASRRSKGGSVSSSFHSVGIVSGQKDEQIGKPQDRTTPDEHLSHLTPHRPSVKNCPSNSHQRNGNRQPGRHIGTLTTVQLSEWKAKAGVPENLPRRRSFDSEPIRENRSAEPKPEKLWLPLESVISSQYSSIKSPKDLIWSVNSDSRKIEIPEDLAILESPSLGSLGGFDWSSVGFESFERDRSFLTPTSPLNPGSLKDLKPSNYFGNVTFKCGDMEPERDTNCPPKPTSFESMERDSSINITKQRGEGHKEQDYVRRFEREILLSTGNSENETPPTFCSSFSLQSRGPRNSEEDSSEDGVSRPNSSLTGNPNPTHGPKNHSHPMETKSSLSKDLTKGSSSRGLSSNAARVSSSQDQPLTNRSRNDRVSRSRRPSGDISSTISGAITEPEGPTLASWNPISHASPKTSQRKYLSNPLFVDSKNATGNDLSNQKCLPTSSTNSSPHSNTSKTSSVKTKAATKILALSDLSGNNLHSDSETSTRNQSTCSNMKSVSGNPHGNPSGSRNPHFKGSGGKTSPPANLSERPYPWKAERESKKNRSGSTQQDTSGLYFKVTPNSSNSAAKTPNVDSNIRRYPYSRSASSPPTGMPNNTSALKPSKKPSSNPTSPLNPPQSKGNIAFFGSSNISNSNAVSQSWSHISNPRDPQIGKQHVVAPKSDLHKEGSKCLHHGSQRSIISSSLGNGPQTSLLSGSSKRSSTNNSVVPTQTQLVESSSPKNTPTVIDAFYSPAVRESVTKDASAPLRDKKRFPSSSSSDSGLNLSDSEDNRRHGKTRNQPEKLNRLCGSLSNSPVSLSPSSEPTHTSPKFPTDTNIFYDATEEQKLQLFSKVDQNSALKKGQFTFATEQRNTGLSSDFSPKSSVLHSARTSEISEKSSETSNVDPDKVQTPSQSFSKTKERSTDMLHATATIPQQVEILSSKERLDASTPPPLLTGGASGKTVPMSGRADSKELLGQLVKKVLTTAAAKQSSSPKASFAETSHAMLKDSGKKVSSNKVFFVPEDDEKEKESGHRSKHVKSGHRSSDTDMLSKGETQETSVVKGSTPKQIKEKTLPGVSVPCPSAPERQPVQTGVSALTVEFSAPEEKTEPEEEKDALLKVIDMIHDEFAFDGYLDDGVEDVNMAEYVMSLAGMSEENFKEAVADQYNDLYWDEDLLHDMFEAITGGQQTRSPTLQFSESSVSDITPPGSINLSREESSASLQPPFSNSISRSSSERSGTGARDVLVSSLGEASEFLPIRVIAPEFQADIHGLLVPIYENYHRVMGVKLASSVEDLLEKLGTKILEISQQLTLERRAKKKNMNSFNKMADVENKKDVKDLALKLLTEIEESDKKIIYLKTVQRQLRNAYAERFGLDTSLLYAFLVSYSQTCVALEPELNNSFLNFSPIWNQRANEAAEILEESLTGPSLQSGSKFGLFSYLFDRHAMSQAYVRYFLYTYRYICTPTELFNFIREKCSASLRTDASGQVYNHQLQIRYRALDLLSEWIDCYYQFDFKLNPELVKDLLAFIKDELILVDRSERGHYLIKLVSERQREDLTPTTMEPTDSVAVLQLEDPQGLSSIDSRKDSPRKLGTRKAKSPVQCFRRNTPDKNTTYKPTLYLKALSVLDHSSRVLAEQLTLIQQDLFSHIHPVHFLNSRAHGIGVSRSQSPTRERDNMFGFSTGSRRISEMSGSEQGPLPWEQNMYVTKVNSDGVLENLLEHAQDVSLWVAVEICSASSVKGQLALITKFVNAARYCCEIRNYSTCVQIIDALEMFVVRQLPVWKQIPTKTTEALEELKAVKVLLKTDSIWLMKSDSAREKPTIPCVFLFVIHVQQQELGGFTLPNDMYKWTKMRSVARLVDQIRLFKQMRYAFQTDDELKTRLKQRIYECKNENLHALASENASNFHLSSSQGSRKFNDAFRKMKATLGGQS